MPIKTADDHALSEIETLLTTVMGKLNNLRWAGPGKDARFFRERTGQELRETLIKANDKIIGAANRWLSMTEKEPAPPPAPRKPRRRQTTRLPDKRKRK